MYLRIKPEELVHKTNKLDTSYWGSVVNKSAGIQSTLTRRADKVIGADIFQALYDWEPKLRSDGPDEALSAWLGSTANTTAFKELREKTVGSREVAAGATVAMYRELMRSQESMLKTIATTKNSLDSMETMMADGPAAEQARGAIAQVQKELADVINNPQPPVDTTGLSNFDLIKLASGKLPGDGAVSAAITKAVDKVQMASELTVFDAQGEGHNISTDARILGMIDSQLMQRLGDNDNLRKIFQIAGRMKVILQQAKSRQPRPAHTPVGLSIGADLSNVLSSEFIPLADPDTEDVFYQRYLEKGLLQYDHKAKQNEGLGPFVCLLDVSGSMRGASEQLAKALFVALAKMGIEKKRKLALIPFADSAGKPIVVDSSTALTNSLTRKFNVGGGTNFAPPLLEATEFIGQEQQFKLADVLLITDGQASLTNDWIGEYIKWKNLLEFRLYGVHIGGGEFHANQLPMFDAMANVTGSNVSKLDWFEPLADRMVR